jgi:hypothetical protein
MNMKKKLAVLLGVIALGLVGVSLLIRSFGTSLVEEDDLPEDEDLVLF